MVSPISNDRITSQTNEQGKATQKGASSNASPAPVETDSKAQSSAATSSDVQISNAGKLYNQAEARATDANKISTYEEARSTLESLKSSFQENGGAALAAAANGLQASQATDLLAPA